MKPIAQVFAIMTCALTLTFCAGSRDRPIKFVYLALGASDAVGVGAIPLTDGYVYLIKRDLDRRMPGVFLMNLGVPAARIDLIKEEVRLAAQVGTKAQLVTLWTGANDLVNGDDPKVFQEDLRAMLGIVKSDISKTIVIANLPDLTKLPRFRERPSPSVTNASPRITRPLHKKPSVSTPSSSIFSPFPFRTISSSMWTDSTRIMPGIRQSQENSYV